MTAVARANQLERLEREAIELESEAEERGMTEAEFAVFSELVEHHKVLLDGEDEAEALARDIYEAFETEVVTSFAGWETNEKTCDHIEVVIIDVLVKEYDDAELVKTEDFIDNVRGNLIENYE